MTTLTDRPNTALLVIDVQNDVMKVAFNRDEVVANIVALVDRARSEQVPVVWVQHSNDEMPIGSDAWNYIAELPQRDAEPVVRKIYGDSFEDTDLERVLAERKVGRLIVAGAQTDACIRSTLHGAFTRGYDTTLVSDAHTTDDLSEWGAPPPEKVIDHTNLYWQFEKAPGRKAGTVTTDEVDFAAHQPA
jgi:nicotinamidase-related amidase